jgi:hypothetical protein
MVLRLTPSVLVAALSAACLEPGPGPTPDSGLDAGLPPDAGTRLDAGAQPDAGTQPDGSVPDGGLAADCATRSGGAFVTVRNDGNRVFPESNVRLWITDAAFIEKARTLVGVASPSVFPLFERVIPRRDCDPSHAWHVDPSKAVFVELSREECDAHGGFVSSNLADWVARPRPDWCPWAGLIALVELRP